MDAGRLSEVEHRGLGYHLPFVALVVITALFSATAMVQAPDTWTALACGRHIAAHGVDDRDPFSFDSRPPAAAALPPGASWWQRLAARWHPTGWINQNWLSHLILYETVRTFGFDALFLARFLIYGVVALCLVLAQRARGVGLAPACVSTSVALAVARWLLEIRPQDFTHLCVALELLILALAWRRGPRVLWALVPLLVVWSNLHGGFIYGFIVLIVFAVADAWRRRGGRGSDPHAPRLRDTALVVLVALAGCVVASPYHLANLTHPLVISVSANAALWRLVDEWHSPFESGASVQEPGVRFFIGFLVVVAATGATWWFLRSRHREAPQGARRRGSTAAGRPEVGAHLPWLAVAVVTLLLAVQSRRFIPLAAFSSAPLLGGWFDEIAHTWPARAGADPARGRRRRSVAAAAAGLLALVLAGFWGWRFVGAYLRPWPHSLGTVSMFDRMAWTFRRGSDAGRFITDNQIEGRMFDSWVDGGFLSWCETPDPLTGEIPLELLIDGRAQGAYTVETLLRYLETRSAGPVGARVARDQRQPSAEELEAMALWTDARLKEERIWVVLLPEDDAQTGIMKALGARPNWQIAFLAPDHVLFADTDDPRGRALVAGVLDGSTRFPDELSRHLTRASLLFRRGDPASARTALAEAVAAYDAEPVPLALQTARRASAYPELAPEVRAFFRRVLDDYEQRRERYRRENGFLVRNGAAIVAATYLRDVTRNEGSSAEADRFESTLEALQRERSESWSRALW